MSSKKKSAPKYNAAQLLQPINVYSHISKEFMDDIGNNPHFDQHKISLPLRMLIVGGSGSGKTQCLVNLLRALGNVFENVQICAKMKDEPIYRWLAGEALEGCTLVDKIEDMKPLDEYDKKEQSLIVMDDMITTRDQRAVEDIFTRGRKRNVSIIYISQSYFRVPLLMRQNSTYLILKSIVSRRDLICILGEAAVGLDKETLLAIYKFALQGEDQHDKRNWLLIDLVASDPQLKFRKNFTPIHFEREATEN